MELKIIISPAKKMRTDPDSLAWQQLPEFLPQAKELAARLQAMDPAALQRLWKCNDAIAAQNQQRLARMDLERGLTPVSYTHLTLPTNSRV